MRTVVKSPSASRRSARFDVALVGAGLQNGLIALALLQRRPDLRIAMFERSARPAGNHTWCFHSLDVGEDARAFVEPLVVKRWDRYEVRFPNLTRRIDARYSCVPSWRLATALEHAFAQRSDCWLACGQAVVDIAPHHVALADGNEIEAPLVIDARGDSGDTTRAGYQKFVGLELELEAPHWVTDAVIMDATGPQIGGFRFAYLLPLSPTRILVEDTCFSHDSALDREATTAQVRAYAHARGWRIGAVMRTEAGVLPMPWSGQARAPTGSPLVAGFRGGWFHPATGYSFPVATRLAAHIARSAPHHVFGAPMRRLHRHVRTQAAYAQLLNRMLFHCFDPDQMWNAFERFYTLAEGTIQRFYALRLTMRDCARILLGRPPRGMSVRAAIGLRRTS